MSENYEPSIADISAETSLEEFSRSFGNEETMKELEVEEPAEPKKEYDVDDSSELKKEYEILIKHKHFEDALLCCDKVIALDPKDIKAWKNKGTTLRRMDKHEDAIVCFDKAIEIDPKHIPALSDKGI